MNNDFLLAAQAPQWLSRCADAQRFLKKEIKSLFLLKRRSG